MELLTRQRLARRGMKGRPVPTTVVRVVGIEEETAPA
jgi:hypothetical protein